MSKITGSGCMLTAMIAAYLVANKDNYTEATAAAISAMGLCGERAFLKLALNNAGNSSFRNYLIDEVFKLKGKELEKGAKYEVR
jgi:hydroxyethylthiazole kinase